MILFILIQFFFICSKISLSAVLWFGKIQLSNHISSICHSYIAFSDGISNNLHFSDELQEFIVKIYIC